MTSNPGSDYLVWLAPGIFGLLGALIGGAAVLLSTVINHQAVRRKELEAIRRARGEETLADIGGLIAWSSRIIVRALEGETTTELSAEKFRIWTNVELYYSTHIELMVVAQKKASELLVAVNKSAQAIRKDNSVVDAQRKIMIDVEMDLIKAYDGLRKELISELRVERTSSKISSEKMKPPLSSQSGQ